MNSNFKYIVSLLFILYFSLIACTQDTRGYKVKVGDKAPDIELVLPDGQKTKLSELKGKVVMLQFTATWCRVCIQEMPHIEKEIWDKLQTNKNFALYGIMYKQNANDAKKMYDLTSVSYPLTLDTDGTRFHQFSEKNAGVTRNIIIDQDGNIAFLTRLFNAEEFNGMVKKIHELLK